MSKTSNSAAAVIEEEPRGATDEEMREAVENCEEQQKNTFWTWLQWLRNRRQENQVTSDQEVVAYAFTVTTDETSDSFEKVQFDHPDENYGQYDGFEVSNVRELTEIKQ